MREKTGRRSGVENRIGLSTAIISALTVSIMSAACTGGTAADKEDVSGPRQIALFVFDRSTSIEDYQLELAQQLTNDRISALRHGDHIAAFQVLQLSLAEPPRRWSQAVPTREFDGMEVARDSITLSRFLRDAKDYLRPYSQPADRDNITGTDLLSTLHDVGEEIRAHPEHAPTVYLFSDMLQSNRMIDMEGLRRMPRAGWAEAAAANGMLPDLRGLCVVVVGARVDTESAQRVKKFWIDYFEVTGATMSGENYMHRPVSVPSGPCPGIQE
jgi:hypothetical protein